MMLEARNISRHFGGLRVLEKVDLSITKGELVGLIGPNGAGKTTLFNILSGFLAPSGGTVHFEGKDIGGSHPHRIAELGLVRTFQGARVFPKLTVSESLRIAAHLRRGRNASEVDLAAKALSEFGLNRYAQELAGSLPAGMMRVLGIVSAISTGARMLLLDEPAAGLAAEEIDHLRQVVSMVNAQGMTVCVIEHNLQFLMGCVSRAVVLDAGTLIANGSPEEVTRNPRVIEAYLGGEELVEG